MALEAVARAWLRPSLLWEVARRAVDEELPASVLFEGLLTPAQIAALEQAVPQDAETWPSFSDPLVMPTQPSGSPAEGRRPLTWPSGSPAEGRRPLTWPSGSPAEGRRPLTWPSDYQQRQSRGQRRRASELGLDTLPGQFEGPRYVPLQPLGHGGVGEVIGGSIAKSGAMSR